MTPEQIALETDVNKLNTLANAANRAGNYTQAKAYLARATEINAVTVIDTGIVSAAAETAYAMFIGNPAAYVSDRADAAVSALGDMGYKVAKPVLIGAAVVTAIWTYGKLK